MFIRLSKYWSFKMLFYLLLIFLLLSSTSCNEGEDVDATVADIPENENEHEFEQFDVDEDKTIDDEDDETNNSRDPPAGQLEVHFIDVGQGDSIYIKTPTQNILIDGGNRGDTALNYLRYQGVSSLDLVIGTHPHADHIGGLINVMQAIPTKEVIDPAVVNETLTFEDYLRLIDQKDIKFTEGRAGITRDLCNGIIMNIIHPNNPLSSDPNNASIVAKLTFGEISFLFTGDAEREAEREMLHGSHDLNATVLKVGHHGSRTSTTQAFLDAVAPQAAVIMCGRNNQYGHPHDETLQSLLGSNVDIYRTDLQGSIVIVTDGIEYTVNKQPFSYSQNQQPPPPNDEYSANGVPGKVNINTACKEELQRIIHIGPARAEAIIKLRPFNSVDDLTRVSGIAEVRLRDIINQGIACVD